MENRLGNLVRETRKANHLTQEKLAEWADISRSYLTQIELGKRQPTDKVARALAAALSLHIYEVFDAADLLTSHERNAAEALEDHYRDSGLSEDAILYAKDRIIISGGTLEISIDGNPSETIELLPRPVGPLLGWDRLTYEHQRLVQQMVNALLSGYPDA